MEHCDFVFGNEDETAAFGKAHGLVFENNRDVCMKIAEFNKLNTERPRVVVCTQGKEPTLVAVHDHKTKETIIREYPVALLEKEKIVDTNSAGDAFVGGFLTQIALGKDVATAVAGGQYCSKLIIQ